MGKEKLFTLNRLANKLNPTNTRLYINKSKAFSGEIIDDKNLKTASKLKKFLVQGTQYLSWVNYGSLWLLTSTTPRKSSSLAETIFYITVAACLIKILPSTTSLSTCRCGAMRLVMNNMIGTILKLELLEKLLFGSEMTVPVGKLSCWFYPSSV